MGVFVPVGEKVKRKKLKNSSKRKCFVYYKSGFETIGLEISWKGNYGGKIVDD
jgi:hypothetical protein